MTQLGVDKRALENSLMFPLLNDQKTLKLSCSKTWILCLWGKEVTFLGFL